MASAADESNSQIPGEDADVLSDSEEDERPNRWRGPSTTWRDFNSEEIATATALKEIQNRDLSVHLYNAFALKQRYGRAKEGVALDGPVAGKDINAATGQLVQPDEWLPQRSWTAWPMRADKVPPVQDSRMNDPDERFTLRKPVREMPSSALEEIISGEILRKAREKFNARPWARAGASDEEADDEPGEDEEDEEEQSDGETVASTSASGKSGSKSRSRSRSKSVKRENASGDEKMDVDAHPSVSKPQDEPDKKPRLKPAVSTDDDLSHSLLRPSVRHILAQLDATLMVLHNVQDSALNYQSDSSNSEASDSSRRSSHSRGRASRPRSRTPAADGVKRSKGRPSGPSSRTRSRARSRMREPTPTPLATEEEGDAPKKRTGRPKKTYPRLDGETDREFAIRIARIRKQPLPVFSDEEPGPEPTADGRGRRRGRAEARSIDSSTSSDADGDGEETAGPSTTARPHRRKRKLPAEKEGKATRTPSSSSASTAASKSSRRPRIGLRDWRDVLGAAALSGFPPAALDRAARRCADLFAQRASLVTLPEVPASASALSARKTAVGREVVYGPRMGYPPLLDLDEDEDGGGDGDEGGGGEGNGGRKMRMAIRTRGGSLAPRSVVSGDEEGDEARPEERRTRSRSVSRTRARSRPRSASAPGSFVCAVKDCPRAADGEGFAWRTNLLRHLKLVHGWAPPTSTTSGSEGLPGLAGEEMTAEEVDSEDEMYGAVHVDGFLKPIRMRSGWRAADSWRRARRTGYGGGVVEGRGRSRSRGRSKGRGGSEADYDGEGDGDGDVRMGGSGFDG
ncbi:uncharacterized protein F4807DRAFT_465288 [Annulohypoxylon truncatum]|uniref:uncharacterized protein n=1 Tax=Annulohypoxylon truncatum TaxID=327061 RepID=UPI0020082204|nr:uncharacterized protein F4807DRAFT_465288 [Annulohypoxylon truncatum]KAI1204786.1 hypothetical protein F4807DRAFT_465288 [Annulohypoxylon truncatum]